MQLKPLKFFSLRSLRFKFALITLLLFLVIFSFATFFLINQVSKFERESLLARADTFVSLATKPLGDAYNLYFNSGNLKFREIFRGTLKVNNTVPRAQIISVNGDILFDSNNLDVSNLAGGTPERVEGSILRAVVADHTVKLKNTKGDVGEIVVPYSDDFGIRAFSIRYFLSYQSIDANINQAIMTSLILLLVFFLVITFSVTLLVDRSIISPLDKVVEVAKAIQSGDLQKKIVINTRDEIGDLASVLNQMTDTLRKNIEGLKQVDKLKDEFILIASHNLRTPLTVIKNYIPLLNEQKLGEEGQSAVKGIHDSADKLYTISESLLSLVSLEKEENALRKTSEDLVDVVREVTSNFKEAADTKKIKLTLDVPPQAIHCQLDKTRIKQALTNILDNAIKFNKAEGTVAVKIIANDQEATISIVDNGIGIKEDEISKMFQKFHRGTDVLTYNYEGIGLGLYLTKIIIESHGGKVDVVSKLNEGTTVTIQLPLEKPESKA